METIELAVNGTLMRGLELNGNLLAVGATFICETTTEAADRMWSIGDRHPAMIKVTAGKFWRCRADGQRHCCQPFQSGHPCDVIWDAPLAQ